MIKAILYDLDGVLVDATEWHYESLNLALEQVKGFKIKRDEHIQTFNGLPTMRKLEILLEQGRVKKDDFDSIWKKKQDLTIEVIMKSAFIDQNKIIAGKIPAGYILEQVGAKGMKVGGIRIADFHGNLFINDGRGKAKDVKKLAKILKDRVQKKFGIRLEEEIRYF